MKFSLRVMLLVLSLFYSIIPTIALAGIDEGINAYSKEDYAAALREFRPIAMQGDAYAQFKIGFMYENGQGVPQNYAKAVKWYRLAAEQGEIDAQVNIGFMYHYGEGIPQDDKEAVKWFRLAADKENVSAQHILGLVYENGQGVPQDYKEAVKWYRLAADKEFALAQHALGLIYENGQGVSQDYKEAVKWYRLAADKGNADSQSKLGGMYENGKGVASNRVVAYALYNLSDPENRAKLAKSMAGNEIEAAQNLSREIAKQGNQLKALDKYAMQSFGRGLFEPNKWQSSPNGISELWILMSIIWVIVEVVGVLRKKELRSRLKSAAIWSTVVTSLATVGQMKTDHNALVQLGVCLTLFGTLACIFYLIRVKLFHLWQKRKATAS